MTIEKAIEMIEEYLLEPNNINKEWVECLQMCKQALVENDQQKAEIERLQKAKEDALKCFIRMESLYKIKCEELEVAKTKAIKEFEERLKEIVDGDINRIYALGGIGGAVAPLCKFKDDIDMVLKELTEKNDFKE